VVEVLSEDIWEPDDSVSVNVWQKEILDQRQRMIEKGQTSFIDWEEAKQRIANLLEGEKPFGSA
jgi:hypothetical protein